MEKELRQVISAIENGKKVQDNRGIVYTQEFGESFLNKLKNIVNQQSYICPKTNQNCDDEMCDSASNCNIDNPLITDSKEISFEEISNQFHQIANDFKHPFEEYEMKSCKTYSDNRETMPKQETLEEAAERILNLSELDGFRDYHYKQELYTAFIVGIKYQQKRSYNEEEVKDIIAETWIRCVGSDGNNFKEVRDKILDNLKKQKKYE